MCSNIDAVSLCQGHPGGHAGTVVKGKGKLLTTNFGQACIPSSWTNGSV